MLQTLPDRPVFAIERIFTLMKFPCIHNIINSPRPSKRSGQKPGRANFQIKTTALTATAANKTAAQPNVGSRSAWRARPKRPALSPVEQTLYR